MGSEMCIRDRSPTQCPYNDATTLLLLSFIKVAMGTMVFFMSGVGYCFLFIKERVGSKGLNTLPFIPATQIIVSDVGMDLYIIGPWTQAFKSVIP